MVLYQLTLWQRLILTLFPALRRRHDAALNATIRWLVEHPEEPVEFK
jgi:hypothetical protein